MATAKLDSDLYWLAGLLEGEGHFGIYRNTVDGKIYSGHTEDNKEKSG
jgi:hypothetical protein